MTEIQIAAKWATAKRKQLAQGYTTQWDRKTARLIRQRQAEGINVSEEQLAFAARVEALVGKQL